MWAYCSTRSSSSRMAWVATQWPSPCSSTAFSGLDRALSKTNRSRTMLVSRTSVGIFGAGRALDHVEAEQPAFDGAVPHRNPPRFLQTHARRKLEVRGQHPGGPPRIVLLPVRGELVEKVATVFGFRPLPPALAAPCHTGGFYALAIGRIDKHHARLV